MKFSFVFKLFTLALFLTVPVLTVSAQGISTDELIIYYSFNADTLVDGDILDGSGNENHGLIKGASLKIVDDGQANECLDFPGVASDYISVRNHSYSDLFPELTLAVWVKTAQRGMIASWDRSEFFRFGVGDDVLGNLTFIGFDVCCPIRDWHGNVEVTDDEWHHVVATFDAEMKRIYVDGELDVEAPTDTNEQMIGKAVSRFGFIGIGSEAAAFDAGVGPSWVFNGLMDEFFLFHRAISADEVSRLAKAPSEPFAVDPDDKLSTTWAHIKSRK